MSNRYVAIMAGGIGSRFWPESRAARPKQFLDILNCGKSLLQVTFERFASIVPESNIYIVTNQQYEQQVKEQLPNIDQEQVVCEPSRRNTAPCVAYFSNKIYALNKNAVIFTSPADHAIQNTEKFLAFAKTAFQFAEQEDALVTMGIKPSKAATGYGYIQYDPEDSNVLGLSKVKTFTEKPDLELAKKFIKSGDFLWNSGMFVWKASTILKAFIKYQPDLHDAFVNVLSDLNTAKEKAAIETAYSQCTNISIDYAIMEKADNVFVLPAEFGWSDVGSWGSLYEIYEKDYLENAVKGKHVQVYDGSGNMIYVPQDKLVVIQGLKDFCVVDSEDVLLIIGKKHEQDIKQITSDLKRNKLDNYL